MHDPRLFRRQLAARILGLLGATSLAAPPLACNGGGGNVTSGTTGTGAAATTTHGSSGTGGAGGASGTGGSTSGGGGAGGAGGAPPNPPVQSCFDWPGDAGADAGACPTDPKAALTVFLAVGCPNGWEPYKVLSGPTLNATNQCCYKTLIKLCGPGGRPYLVEDRARVAAPERGAGKRQWGHGDRPRLDGLTPGQRASLAEAWTQDALLEHASVASFSRFSLALLAVGAPADLVELAHQAALDEIGHARLCFALAADYAGEDIAPGPFPLGVDVHVEASLVALAVSTFKEGCVGETVAAAVAAEQLARATDPAVQAALAQIAADEARHAELAWRTVAWAVQAGGREVRAAVEQAFHEALAQGCQAREPETTGAGAMEAHGRLDAATVARITASALEEIVSPCARALAASPGSWQRFRSDGARS